MRRNQNRKGKSRKPDGDRIKKLLVNVADIKTPFNGAIYGQSGTGKTTFLGTCPKPLLLADISEKGTESIRTLKEVKILRPRSWNDLEDLVWFLREDKKYKTVGIDTVSQVQELILKHLLGDNPMEWGQITQRTWGLASVKLKNFITDLRDIEHINTIFIAHDRVFNSNEDEDYDDDDSKIDPVVGPRLMPSAAAVLNASVSFIGNTFIREKKVKVKGKSKMKIKYCLRIGPHHYYITKVRKPKEFELPQVIENPTYDKVHELIHQD